MLISKFVITQNCVFDFVFLRLYMPYFFQKNTDLLNNPMQNACALNYIYNKSDIHIA